MWAKKIDDYRRHRFPMSRPRATGQSLVMHLLHFCHSELTIMFLYIVYLADI